MPRYLLDTSVCVDILRGIEGSDLPPTEQCCLSAIVTAELWTGLAMSPSDSVRAEMLEDFVSLFRLEAFGDHAARHYGDIRADLEGRGLRIGPMDLLIAAHARSLGATLVSGNVKEFERVPKLDLLAWSPGA